MAAYIPLESLVCVTTKYLDMTKGVPSLPLLPL